MKVLFFSTMFEHRVCSDFLAEIGNIRIGILNAVFARESAMSLMAKSLSYVEKLMTTGVLGGIKTSSEYFTYLWEQVKDSV